MCCALMHMCPLLLSLLAAAPTSGMPDGALVCLSVCFSVLPQPQPEPSAGADSDDDWSMGNKKGKKGKAAAGGKAKGGKAAANNSSSGAAAGGKQQKGGADVNSILSVNVLAQQVLKLYPDMEDAGEQHPASSKRALQVFTGAVAKSASNGLHRQGSDCRSIQAAVSVASAWLRQLSVPCILEPAVLAYSAPPATFDMTPMLTWLHDEQQVTARVLASPCPLCRLVPCAAAHRLLRLPAEGSGRPGSPRCSRSLPGGPRQCADQRGSSKEEAQGGCTQEPRRCLCAAAAVRQRGRAPAGAVLAVLVSAG